MGTSLGVGNPASDTEQGLPQPVAPGGAEVAACGGRVPCGYSEGRQAGGDAGSVLYGYLQLQ